MGSGIFTETIQMKMHQDISESKMKKKEQKNLQTFSFDFIRFGKKLH